MIRTGIAGMAGLALFLAAACAPIEVRMDGPLPGAQATLTTSQPLSVRLSNVAPENGSWEFDGGDLEAVSFEGKDVRPPANGVRQLESFRFTGTEAGQELLTFNYIQKDGVISDQITVTALVR